jgi:hypothetical protein
VAPVLVVVVLEYRDQRYVLGALLSQALLQQEMIS